MELRYQAVLKSIDGQQEYNASENFKTMPSIAKCEKLFKSQIQKGRMIEVNVKSWDSEDNEPYELVDIITLKTYR